MGNRKTFRAGSRHAGTSPRVQGNTLRMNHTTDLWADLEDADRNCLAAEAGAAFVMPYLRSSEMKAKIADLNGLNDAIQHYTNLVAEKKQQRLDLLRRWSEYRDSKPTPGPDSMVQILDYGQEYNTWLTEWVQVVMYAGDVLLDFYRATGAPIPVFCPYSTGFRGDVVEAFAQANPDTAVPIAPVALEGEYIPHA